MSKEQILTEVLALDAKDQQELVAELQAIIHPADLEIERAWMEEAERRFDRILDGTDPTYDGEEVMQANRHSISKT